VWASCLLLLCVATNGQTRRFRKQRNGNSIYFPSLPIYFFLFEQLMQRCAPTHLWLTRSPSSAAYVISPRSRRYLSLVFLPHGDPEYSRILKIAISFHASSIISIITSPVTRPLRIIAALPVISFRAFPIFVYLPPFIHDPAGAVPIVARIKITMVSYF
jgi:hypothetical protein